VIPVPAAIPVPPEIPATRVLLTGFEPFGGEAVNPSWRAVSLVAA
jgi:pyroglutamyl-peptidase